jgi:molecular chaperone DnaK
MRALLCLLVLVGCGSKNDEPPPSARGMAPVPPPAAPVVSPPAGGVTQKLFADDVAAGTLPLSISIETIGNVATVLIPRGTPLPVTRTEVFSTAADDQPSVEVHVLQGERPLASDNRSLGKFQMIGIPPALRGVPQVAVTFSIDAAGALTVSALDKATGQTKQIMIEGALGSSLRKADIDRLLADAAAAKPDDDKRAAWAEQRNKLDTLVYSSRSVYANFGDKLKPEMRKRYLADIELAERMLAATTTPGDPAVLRVAHATLDKTSHDVAEALYSGAR